MKVYKAIGYWYSSLEPYLPHPKVFVDEEFDLDVKDWIIRYLKTCDPILHYRGFSNCRFKCAHPTPGTSDNCDGEFIFPSGFIHYVSVHNVKPPEEFIERVMQRKEYVVQREEDEKSIVKRLLRERGLKEKKIEEYRLNFDWWIQQAKIRART